MRVTDIVTGGTLALFALLGLFWLIPSQITDVEGASMPPSLVPRLCLIGILILSAALVLRAALAASPAADAPMRRAQWIHLAKVLVIVGASVAVIRYGGFFLGSALLVSALMIIVCRRPPLRSLLWGAGVAAVIQVPLHFLPLSLV